MPLCPVCIREHSQYHNEAAIKPQYFSISEILDEVQNSLKVCIGNLEQDRLRNVVMLRNRAKSSEKLVVWKELSKKK